MPLEEFGVVYREVDDALSAHAIAVGCTEQESKRRLHYRSALESALERPQHWAYYEQADIVLQAAVLAHGIAENQPFIDGNKRTAAVAMEAFLTYNGYHLTAMDDEVVVWMLELSDGLLPGDFSNQLRPLVRPVLQP